MVWGADPMNRILSALGAGLIFGLGIAVSGMGNPAKVLNFLGGNTKPIMQTANHVDG